MLASRSSSGCRLVGAVLGAVEGVVHDHLEVPGQGVDREGAVGVGGQALVVARHPDHGPLGDHLDPAVADQRDHPEGVAVGVAGEGAPVHPAALEPDADIGDVPGIGDGGPADGAVLAGQGVHPVDAGIEIVDAEAALVVGFRLVMPGRRPLVAGKVDDGAVHRLAVDPVDRAGDRPALLHRIAEEQVDPGVLALRHAAADPHDLPPLEVGGDHAPAARQDVGQLVVAVFVGQGIEGQLLDVDPGAGQRRRRAGLVDPLDVADDAAAVVPQVQLDEGVLIGGERKPQLGPGPAGLRMVDHQLGAAGGHRAEVELAGVVGDPHAELLAVEGEHHVRPGDTAPSARRVTRPRRVAAALVVVWRSSTMSRTTSAPAEGTSMVWKTRLPSSS